jgi:hypothetical protein
MPLKPYAEYRSVRSERPIQSPAARNHSIVQLSVELALKNGLVACVVKAFGGCKYKGRNHAA